MMIKQVTAVLLLISVCWGPAVKAESTVKYNHFGPGMVVYWEYRAPEIDTMRLDFWSGGDIVFHISVHYGTQTTPGVLSLNSFLGGSWGEQEWHSSFPLAPGQRTSLTIVAGEDRFYITARAAGNVSQCEYRYRHQGPATEIKGSQGTQKVILGKVLTNYQPGRIVYVHGTAPDSGPTLTKIAVGEPGEPPVQDLAITIRQHITNNDVHLLSRNNNTYYWLPIEGGPKPFSAGQPFSLAITCQLYGFQVAVNGRHFYSYTHRLPIVQTMTVWTRWFKEIEKIEYY